MNSVTKPLFLAIPTSPEAMSDSDTEVGGEGGAAEGGGHVGGHDSLEYVQSKLAEWTAPQGYEWVAWPANNKMICKQWGRLARQTGPNSSGAEAKAGIVWFCGAHGTCRAKLVRATLLSHVFHVASSLHA